MPTRWHYIIGDIHGCYQELLMLEERILRHAARHRVEPLIVSAGDLVDRGPDSARVVAHFYQGSQRGTHVAVMGNHELLVLELLQEFAPENFAPVPGGYPAWLPTYRSHYLAQRGLGRWLAWEDFRIYHKCVLVGQGGYQTLASFGCQPHDPGSWQLPPHLLAYLSQLPWHFETGDFVLTHALASREALQTVRELNSQRQKLSPRQRERWLQALDPLVWNRVLPQACPDDRRWHISGHTPLPKVKRSHKVRCIQLDTACVFGGRLTAFCPEAGYYLMVRAQAAYWRP